MKEQTLFQRVQQLQAGMEQGLYSEEEYRNLLIELALSAT